MVAWLVKSLYSVAERRLESVGEKRRTTSSVWKTVWLCQKIKTRHWSRNWRPWKNSIVKRKGSSGQGEITLQSDSANVNKADMSRVHVMALWCDNTRGIRARDIVCIFVLREREAKRSITFIMRTYFFKILHWGF